MAGLGSSPTQSCPSTLSRDPRRPPGVAATDRRLQSDRRFPRRQLSRLMARRLEANWRCAVGASRSLVRAPEAARRAYHEVLVPCRPPMRLSGADERTIVAPVA